ncbi:MAG: hypothetical protein J0M02_09360 [Planctomycetes bacterium]|nr:hypothetical protein [Planctomycetota bacterium]
MWITPAQAADSALRKLFPSDMRERQKKLMSMIIAAERGMGDLGRLVPAPQDLGRRHAG